MKTRSLLISLAAVCATLNLTGCLSDKVMTDGGSSSSGSAYVEPVPADDVVEKRVFALLDLDRPGMEAVKTAVESEEWGKASVALLRYYRERADVVNPNVNLLNIVLTPTDQSYADYALKENGYRFYVKNYFEDKPANTKPYSYITAEGTINWQYNPTGEQEQRFQVHRHQWFSSLAKVYKTTGDEKYLKSWMEVYDDWWLQNPKPEQSITEDQKISWRPLEVSERVKDQCDLLEYFKWAEGFTPEYLTRFLWRISEQVEYIKNNYSNTSNHLIFEAEGVTIAGMLFPEMKNADAWLANGAAKLGEEVKKQYYPDGWLKDNDFSYHMGTIETFRKVRAIALINNKQGYFNDEYVQAIRKMVDVEKYLIYPNYAVYNAAAGDYNYSIPNFGDTRAISGTRSVLTRHMRQYRELFPDDNTLVWLASQGKEGQQPVAGIKCFRDGGHYTIRNGWTKDAMMMMFVNAAVTPDEQWHRQWDNNNFELYIKGRQFFPDSGVFSYGGSSSSNADRRKYAATRTHSTMTLDAANIASCRGVCLKSEEGATDLLVLENPSYAGLTHRRAVFFVDRKFFVLIDEGYGDAAGTVNLNFHLLPGSDSEVAVDLAAKGANTNFSDKNNIAVRTFTPNTFLAASTLQSNLSISIGASVARKAYSIDVTKTAGEPAVRFITVILPTQDAAAASIDASFTDAGFSANGAAAKVVVDGRTYNLSYTL